MLSIWTRPSALQILAKRIHLAPDSLKYCVFVEKQKEQVQLERKALGTIQRKPELYCIPLKWAPVIGGGATPRKAVVHNGPHAREGYAVGH